MKKLIVLLLLFSRCTITNPVAYVEIPVQTISITSTNPQQPVPASPTLTSVSGNGQIVLSWPTQIDAQSYNLYFGNSPGVLGPGPLNVSSPYNHNVANGSTIYFALTAVNSIGESLQSPEVHATSGVIDNHNGTIYVYTLNQTWPKCAQSDITGKNMYNPTLDNCSGSPMGTFQNCSTNDMTCAPPPGYVLNGSGYSEIWLSCNNNTLAGRLWRVPRDNELIAFQPIFIVNQILFSGITTDGYWSANDDWNMPGRVILYDGMESYPDRRWLNPVICVSDGM